ncbi:hypothetical protein NPIL_613331, partial [Nephila pilipes]
CFGHLFDQWSGLYPLQDFLFIPMGSSNSSVAVCHWQNDKSETIKRLAPKWRAVHSAAIQQVHCFQELLGFLIKERMKFSDHQCQEGNSGKTNFQLNSSITTRD